MIRPEDIGKMVDIVSCKFSNGARLEVRAPIEEARWLRALFTRNDNPFKVLRDMGYDVVSEASRASETK